jgi:ABC-type multidrug transport system ATPase subunit
MIEARGICKRFRSLDVLVDAHLAAAPGAITLLTGANGSGKSTLLKILAGLQLPDGGTARIDGRDMVRSRLAAQRRMAFLPQNVAFHPAATPEGILAFYGRLRGVDATRQRQALEEVALRDAATRPVSKLSGGMLQRLGLALVLLPGASAIILDEPGAGLDPEWRMFLRERLLDQARQGRTILLTSHLPEEWADAATAFFDCREGRIFSKAGEVVAP